MVSVAATILALCLLVVCSSAVVDARSTASFGTIGVVPLTPFAQGCSVKITGDLGEPQPLILNPTTNDFLYPDGLDNIGVLTFTTNQQVDLFCSTGFATPATSATRLSAYCESGINFSTVSGVKNFTEITCKAYPYHSVRRTGNSCAGGQGIALEVGFDLGDKFISYIDLCHDEVNEVSLYSHVPMSALNYGYQSGFDRPSFINTGFFNGKYVDTLYTNVNQVAMGTKILGSEEQALKFFQPVATNKYLARGHLTAKVEVIYGSQQRGTFWFMNAAPQFQSFNGGNWEAVESSTRRFMMNRRIVNGEVYSGTHGILTLPDINNVQQQIFMYFDENNNGLIPAPELFYKIIIDKDAKSGIAIIGLNNIYLTQSELAQHIHCNDISDQIDWITWDKANINYGYCYACEVNEFAAFVGTLPNLNVDYVLLSWSPYSFLIRFYVDCILNLSEDMAVPQPLVLNANGSDFLLPQWNDTKGLMFLSAGHSINLYCPNGIKNFDTNMLKVTCIGDKIFQMGLEKQRLKNVRCQKHPWISLKPLPGAHTRNYCLNNSLTDIGFRVSDNVFLKTMSICHDIVHLSTFFTIYQLRPYNVAYQKGVGRLSFIEAREFNHTKTYSRLYAKENQLQRVEQILGSDEDVDEYFNNEKLFFSRGHLGGKVDFFSANHQRSTFFYLNTAPQFQVINGGNWLRVEDGIRRYVAKKKFNATIVSGTHGILRFPSLTDEEWFLGTHEQLPVPQYFYKLIYDEDNSQGVVFVSINNPHIDEEEVAEYLFCNNIIDDIKWVSVKKSLSAGYIFACDVDEFVQEMPPHLLPPMHVTSVLL